MEKKEKRAIIDIVHKPFYASGFLYHSPTQQILLHLTSPSVSWSLFGHENKKSEAPETVFHGVIQKHFSIKLSPKSIHAVYDYFHEKLGKNHFVLYAEIKVGKTKCKSKKGMQVEWFTFKQLSKLPLDEQTKRDILVAQRVINMVARDLQTPEEKAAIALLHKR